MDLAAIIDFLHKSHSLYALALAGGTDRLSLCLTHSQLWYPADSDFPAAAFPLWPGKFNGIALISASIGNLSRQRLGFLQPPIRPPSLIDLDWRRPMHSSTNCPYTLDQQRQRLERLVNGSQPTPSRPLIRILISTGAALMKCLTAEPQIRIWQRTRNGRQIWFAYDPVTDQKRQFCSEQEVRLWLDTRYYE